MAPILPRCTRMISFSDALPVAGSRTRPARIAITCAKLGGTRAAIAANERARSRIADSVAGAWNQPSISTPVDSPLETHMHRFPSFAVLAAVGFVVVACQEAPSTPETPAGPSFSTSRSSGPVLVVNVSRDTTAQNETPLAVNPANPSNMITGNNDWNYNDGCGVNATFDGGQTWTPTGPDHPLTLVSAFQGEGKARGSNGQFPDHESITVANDGTIYVPWAHFTGFSGHSPIFIAVSRDGGKSTAMFVSVSTDHGATWSKSFQFATFQNPVCLYPPYCFNISGSQFRAPGSYPAPPFDPTTGRLYVAYTDIVGGKAQILVTYANVSDITNWTTPTVVAPASGDRINVELSVEPSSGRLDLMTNDRSYAGNTLFDVSYITSGDGGQTWSTTRVTKSSWDPAAYG